TVSTLVSGDIRTLTVNGVEDLSGNATNNETIQFEYIETEEAGVNDVVVNEFLADPIPSFGLPEAEFVELFNRSDKNINLLGWKLDGSQLQSFIIKPNQYVLLVDDSDLAEFSAFERIIGIASLSLSNDEDKIVLTDSTGQEIHTILYEESASGISKELINPNDPCLSAASYVESINPMGGTPGAQNSVFDDTPDTQSPQILSYSFDDALTITFSEVMDSLSLINGSYAVSDGLTIDEVTVNGLFPQAVIISFLEQPDPGIIYELTVSNVSDCPGNTIEETTILFGVGRSPSFNDLIITEIMFNPDPQIELPVREFIEVYNRTNQILSTTGLMLTDATETVEIPTRMLNPGEFYVLTSTSGASEFGGNVIGIPGFPSLNNSGEQLILTMDQNLIFSVDYNPDWHDEDKVEGGFTLEMKDLENPCMEANNWGSSQNARGGTPGLANSISESFPDNFPPEIVEAVALSSDSISIAFNEKISPESQNMALFEIPNIGIGDIHFNSINPKGLIISLNQELEENTLYILTASGVLDCSGNSSNEESIQFALPIEAKEQEIKLNEILFNPRSNGVDFVEIVNTSENYISLKNWQLASEDDQGDVDNLKIITSDEIVIDPGRYLVFTTDKELLLTNYPKGQFENFMEVGSLPSYPNDEGT
ncbi:MAG: lamin tail domain-containing protein, partial [Ekhidna sp.]